MFFGISEQAHKYSVLDFVDRTECFTFYIEWFHQHNKFAAPIKNMQGINACFKEY